MAEEKEVVYPPCPVALLVPGGPRRYCTQVCPHNGQNVLFETLQLSRILSPEGTVDRDTQLPIPPEDLEAMKDSARRSRARIKDFPHCLWRGGGN